MNCWEYMKCGREPGGEQCEDKGVCPAAIEERLDGLNGGVNGGRACWGVDDTDCLEKIDAEHTRCLDCPFFHLVEDEQRGDFQVMLEIWKRLKD